MERCAGRTAAYIVLGWWHQENELPLKVFVRGYDTRNGVPRGTANRSACGISK